MSAGVHTEGLAGGEDSGHYFGRPTWGTDCHWSKATISAREETRAKIKSQEATNMRQHSLLVLLSVLLTTAPACELGPINWPNALKCGPGVDDAIGSVSEVLLGNSDVAKELESLAYTHGTDTVVCLVERLRSDWSAPGASATPARANGVQRADAFLTEIGTKFE